eukprot:6901901-Prymnesium_polylepis.1
MFTLLTRSVVAKPEAPLYSSFLLLTLGPTTLQMSLCARESQLAMSSRGTTRGRDAPLAGCVLGWRGAVFCRSRCGAPVARQLVATLRAARAVCRTRADSVLSIHGLKGALLSCGRARTVLLGILLLEALVGVLLGAGARGEDDEDGDEHEPSEVHTGAVTVRIARARVPTSVHGVLQERAGALSPCCPLRWRLPAGGIRNVTRTDLRVDHTRGSTTIA